MPLPRLPDLLAALDGETHAARCQHVVALARAERDGAALARLLDQLAAQSDYHAVLAVTGAAAAGDAALLGRLGEHQSPRVARAARAASPLPDDPDTIVAGYLRATPLVRQLLRRRLARGRRADVVDRLVAPELSGADVSEIALSDAERAALLAAASGPVAAAYLPDLADLVPNLTSLAHRHPALVLRHLTERATGALPPIRDHWWAWAGPAIGLLVAHDAAAVLDLLVAAGPSSVLPYSVERSIGALLRADAHRVAVLFADPRHPIGYRLPAGLLAHAANLAVEDRIRIAKRLRQSESQLAQFLDALPPADRGAVFDGMLDDVGVATWIWSDEVLAVLPHGVRHREARRILALPAVRDRALGTIHYRGFLPAAEAAPLLEPARRAPDAEERATAYVSMLLASARERDPAALAAALADLDRLRNEQDPVRLEVATALATIPAWLVAAAGLAPLAGFATAVAAARDTAASTLHAVQRTIWRVTLEALGAGDDVLARDALRVLDTLAAPTGTPHPPALTGLPRGRERAIVAALLPRMRTAAAKDDYQLVFALHRALGERAWGITELDELLQQALRAPSDSTVRSAAQAWLADPHTRAERVAAALRTDESLAILPMVQGILCHSRQDLLDVLWERRSLRGRLWGRKPRYVPLLDGPFTRWLPRQLQAYADALADLIATPGTATHTQTRAIATLGRLPEVGFPVVSGYLSSPEVVLREAALAALARTDRPAESLVRLLGVRSGDEVRVAMYAVGRCLRHVPGAVALPMLAAALADSAVKVTARKELGRLLGQVREPAALDLVAGVGLDPAGHRDVRIAAGRTVRAWLDDPRAWTVLAGVAAIGLDGARSLAETDPAQLPERHRGPYAAVLGSATTSGDASLLAALGRWAPWLPEAMPLLVGVVGDVQRSARPAVAALRWAVRHGASWEPVARAAGDLAERSLGADQPDAGAEMDVPLRQRLALLVGVVTDLPVEEVAAHRERLVELVGVLAAYPEARGPAVLVAARAVDWAAPREGLDRLVALVDEPLRCADLRVALGAAVAAYGMEPTEAIRAAVETLVAEGSLAAGTAALAVIAWAGGVSGWNPMWRNLLRELRRHESATLRAWARDTVTVETP